MAIVWRWQGCAGVAPLVRAFVCCAAQRALRGAMLDIATLGTKTKNGGETCIATIINTAFVLSHIGPAALDQAPQRGSIIAEVPLTVSSTEAGDSRSPTVTVYVPAPTHRTPLSST